MTVIKSHKLTVPEYFVEKIRSRHSAINNYYEETEEYSLDIT
jgi:hypothetical protein